MREALGSRKANTGAASCYQGNLPGVFRGVNV